MTYRLRVVISKREKRKKKTRLLRETMEPVNSLTEKMPTNSMQSFSRGDFGLTNLTVLKLMIRGEINLCNTPK